MLGERSMFVVAPPRAHGRLRIGRLTALVCVALPIAAHAQSGRYVADKAELIRRVEAGETEGGFCATVKFPQRTVVNDYFKFLDDATEGAEFFARSNYPTSGGCTYYVVLSASVSDGNKCRRMRSWACFDKGEQAGSCFKMSRTWCHDGDRWTWKPD